MRTDFSAAEAEAALRRLDALKLALAEEQSRERIQAAVVLLAAGDPDMLAYNARLAETDWRDVLVFSGRDRLARASRLFGFGLDLRHFTRAADEIR